MTRAVFQAYGKELTLVVPPSDVPENKKRLLIEQTADSIAELMMIDGVSGLVTFHGANASERIAERRQALEEIGANVEEEIAAATQRFQALPSVQQVARCLRYAGF